MSRRIGEWVPGSEDWLAARRGRIGGSEIGSVAGWNEPWQTRDGLLAEKRGEVERGPVSNAMKRGTHMEAAIRSWLTAEEGVTLREDLRGTYVHPLYDFALANPDDIDSDGVLWEYKAPAVRDLEHGWGRAGSGDIPLTYAAQGHWNAGVVGATKIRFCVWAGAPKFEPAFYKFDFDLEVFEYLIRLGEQFIAELNDPAKETAA
jgi:putative phage-type endonuclease